MKQLKRIFQLGALSLDDPDPTMTVAEVKRVHSQQFPQVRFTTLYAEDGVPKDIAGDTVLLFEYVLPPVSTNG
ncbi:PRTRC system protein C [Photobacterium sp. ZSDE20]|uniref:PRTRC system protein C n=1 Tax=Photobacterium pectinilyticum TaxID=2906793 RepID=A0ABT1N0W2_9GAMM|nr:PRTRC system protein C [Photobacterium sp. ZSDE20]MCQ1058373.1 PRTRC system protein C [Photobacterium sp. ZSDE20]MDD1825264.1 PRTRC system protein C [Photobacterium sp. ZSDE20]